jgi:hypothetical protein
MTRGARHNPLGGRRSAATWLLTLALVGGLLPVASCRKEPGFAQVTINGRTWLVDLALTAEQRYQGLSGRRRLSEDAGMLFIYPHPKVLEFCMRGCYVPLDIAFIDENRRVVRVCTMAVEEDFVGRQTYSSLDPAQYALEVPAGALQAAGVQPGNEVVFSGAVPAPTKAQGDP